MMYTISKQFTFSASHQLDHLPPDHPCARLHGHNYIVEVELQAHDLDSRSFVLDYGELRPLQGFIDEVLDHRHLNDIPGLSIPTTENIAWYLYRFCQHRWPQTYAVRVSETPKTWASYHE